MPSVVRAHVLSLDSETDAQVMLTAETAVGMAMFVVLPMPSWPSPFKPCLNRMARGGGSRGQDRMQRCRPSQCTHRTNGTGRTQQ